VCDNCPGQPLCRLIRDPQKTDRVVWRCDHCPRKVSIRKDSFFYKSHLQLRQLLCFLYFWAVNASQTLLMREAEITREAAVDWCNFARDVCYAWVTDHSGPIGGIDAQGNPISVQIDESKFMHRKYHRGQYREGHWVFGGIEDGTNNCFLVECPGNRHDAATLLAYPSSRRGFNQVAESCQTCGQHIVASLICLKGTSTRLSITVYISLIPTPVSTPSVSRACGPT